MENTELLMTGVGIITTLIGFGWKLGAHLGDIKTTVARIETLLSATSARIDKIEVEVKDIDRRLREHERSQP